MGARAEAAERTSEEILAAAAEVFWSQPRADLALDEVARRAGVSVRTVLRKFGSKEGLLAAAGDREQRLVGAQRGQAPPGDVEAAMEVLLEHYESYGTKVLRLLAAESSSPALRELADRGRAVHRQWCRTVFAPFLSSLRGVARRRREAQFVAICDVQTWRLLRLDSGLSVNQTRVALTEMVMPLTKEN